MGSGLAVGITVVIGVTLLFIAGGLWFWQRGAAGEASAARALKQLLLDRAQGRLSAEEFDLRQAQVHGSLLSAASPLAARASLGLAAAGVVLVGIGVVLSTGSPEPSAGAAAVPTSATPHAMPSAPMGASPLAQGGAAGNAGDMQAMVKRLADKLKADPSNGEGWLLLGKASIEIGDHRQAAEAFGKAIDLVPANASLLADFADAHVMSNGRQWDAQAKAAIGKALAADPKHLKALALAGSEAFDRKDFKAAVAFWERIIAAAAADSIEARAAQANIVEAKALIDGKPATAPASASAPAPTPAR